jgi:hypothetical protein
VDPKQAAVPLRFCLFTALAIPMPLIPADSQWWMRPKNSKTPVLYSPAYTARAPTTRQPHPCAAVPSVRTAVKCNRRMGRQFFTSVQN